MYRILMGKNFRDRAARSIVLSRKSDSVFERVGLSIIVRILYDMHKRKAHEEDLESLSGFN